MNKYMISKILFGLSLFLSQTSFFNTNAMAPVEEIDMTMVSTGRDENDNPITYLVGGNFVKPLPDANGNIDVYYGAMGVYSPTGDLLKVIPATKRPKKAPSLPLILKDFPKKGMLLKQNDQIILAVFEGNKIYNDLSELQLAVLLNEKEKIKPLLNKMDDTDNLISLIEFARKFSEDKETIEILENELTMRRQFTKHLLGEVLPVGDLQDISLDYLDMPRKK